MKKFIFTFLLIYLGATFFTSCFITTSEVPEENTETLVFLVKKNDENTLQSITIENSNDGKGIMTTPKIFGNGFSRTFDMIIDKVNSNKWNFKATLDGNGSSLEAEGDGFYTKDSIYFEMKWNFTSTTASGVDIYSGHR